MTHSRLNNLFLLYMHVASTDNLDLQAVAQEFVGVNSRIMQFFGKCSQLFVSGLFYAFVSVLAHYWC